MERYNDDELLYLMRCGSQEAEQCLYRYYYKQVKNWVMQFCGYYINGYDCDDYVQVAMMGFYCIVESYRDDQRASFKTFMKKAVMRRVLTFLAAGNETKLYHEHTVFSLDEFVTTDNQIKYEEVIEDPKQRYNPQKIMLVKEQESLYLGVLQHNTSILERKAVALINDGYTHEEIAKMLDVSVKSVYNAIYRYHKKAQAIDELNEMC